MTPETVTDLTTLIAAGTTLKGEITFSGPARISGRIEGIIRAEDLLEITEESSVEGELHGTFIDIQGSVKGLIHATKSCRLNATARITGELRAANLAIAEGAAFCGKVFVGAEAEEEVVEPVAAVAPAAAQSVPAVQVGARAQEPHIRMPQQDGHTPATLLQSRLEQMAVEAEQVAVAAAQGHVQEPQMQINHSTVQNTLNRQPRIIKAGR